MTKDKTKHDCSNCSAFGKHCPHKVNGDPYYYDCVMTVEDLEKENAELKSEKGCESCTKFDEVQLTKAKEHIRTLISCLIDWVQEGDKDYCYITDAEEFLKESE